MHLLRNYIALICLLYLDFLDNIPNIIGGLSIFLIFWEIAFSIIPFGFLLVRGKSLLKDSILTVMQSNPNLNINQIADHVAYSPIIVENIINKLLKKGQVEREVINGNIKWIVKEKYGTNNKSQGND